MNTLDVIGSKTSRDNIPARLNNRPVCIQEEIFSSNLDVRRNWPLRSNRCLRLKLQRLVYARLDFGHGLRKYLRTWRDFFIKEKL